jgi:hypothetical protein
MPEPVAYQLRDGVIIATVASGGLIVDTTNNTFYHIKNEVAAHLMGLFGAAKNNGNGLYDADLLQYLLDAFGHGNPGTIMLINSEFSSFITYLKNRDIIEPAASTEAIPPFVNMRHFQGNLTYSGIRYDDASAPITTQGIYLVWPKPPKIALF